MSSFSEYKLDNVIRRQLVDLPFPKELRADFKLSMVELPRAGVMSKSKKFRATKSAGDMLDTSPSRRGQTQSSDLLIGDRPKTSLTVDPTASPPSPAKPSAASGKLSARTLSPIDMRQSGKAGGVSSKMSAAPLSPVASRSGKAQGNYSIRGVDIRFKLLRQVQFLLLTIIDLLYLI